MAGTDGGLTDVRQPLPFTEKDLKRAFRDGKKHERRKHKKKQRKAKKHKKR